MLDESMSSTAHNLVRALRKRAAKLKQGTPFGIHPGSWGKWEMAREYEALADELEAGSEEKGSDEP